MDVIGFDLPAAAEIQADYLIAALTNDDRAAAAASFRDFVVSSEGQAILASYGFGPG